MNKASYSFFKSLPLRKAAGRRMRRSSSRENTMSFSDWCHSSSWCVCKQLEVSVRVYEVDTHHAMYLPRLSKLAVRWMERESHLQRFRNRGEGSSSSAYHDLSIFSFPYPGFLQAGLSVVHPQANVPFHLSTENASFEVEVDRITWVPLDECGK